MATLTSILNAFQTQNAAITGVTSAPQVGAYPDTLTLFPTALTVPGNARWHPGGGRMGSLRKCEREYVIRVYIDKASAPNFHQVLATALSLLEAFGTTYRALSTIGGATVQFNPANGLEDGGFLRTFRYAAEEFFAFEVRVPVTEPNS